MCLGNCKLPFYLKKGRNIFDMTVGHTRPGFAWPEILIFQNLSSSKSQVLWLMTTSWRNISSNHLSKSNNFLCDLPGSFYPSLPPRFTQPASIAEFLLLKYKLFRDQININKLWKLSWEKQFLLEQLKLSIEFSLSPDQRCWIPGSLKQEQINPIRKVFSWILVSVLN